MARVVQIVIQEGDSMELKAVEYIQFIQYIVGILLKEV